MVETPEDEVTQDDIEEAEETIVEAEDASSVDDEVTQDDIEEVEETIVEAEDASSVDDEVTQDDIVKAEEESSSLVEALGTDLEFLHGDNMSFYQANKAYYEDQNYEQAIAEFQAAIEYESAQDPDSLDSVEDSEDSADQAEVKEPNEITAKSMYWMGESYLKLNQIDQAVETFGRLSKHFNQHYLRLAAQRRIASLRLDEESESV